MAKKDPRIDAYIERSPEFARPILTHLRALVHEGCPDVAETMKWSRPTFDHHGIMCGMAAFKEHCTLHFWKAALLTLDGRPLSASGQMESGTAQFGRLTSVKDLPARSKLLKLVRDAARLNEDGIVVARAPHAAPKPVEVPRELSVALRRNAAARAAFEAFPPSHKREYVEWIVEAKTAETRDRRIQTALAQMAEGKSRHWKYQRK
jgi:uncharacterized protein YdeI (YjbR/CyaY-like superfamily)